MEAAKMACGSKELDLPFPVSPSGGKPGGAGSPHAGSTLRASKKRWRASMLPAPPTRGLPPPCVSPAEQRSGFGRGCGHRDRPGGLRRRHAYTNLLTTPFTELALPAVDATYRSYAGSYGAVGRTPAPKLHSVLVARQAATSGTALLDSSTCRQYRLLASIRKVVFVC